VPTAFFTAYYALHELARLREGERVLIHGGAGGVGIAAIQLAKHLGAEIFATAGMTRSATSCACSAPIMSSIRARLAFADEVLKATGGAGVDVILNSLAGDAIPRNLRLLRPFGRMLELGKRDFYENSQVGLRPFRNNNFVLRHRCGPTAGAASRHRAPRVRRFDGLVRRRHLAAFAAPDL